MASKRKNLYQPELESPTKLRRYDPSVRPGAASKREEVPFDWSFYNNEDTFLIDDIIHARCAWNTYHKAYMIHFARQTRSGTVSYVSFSTFEAHSVVDFMEKILHEIDQVEDLGLPTQKLIPFFKDPERPYEHEKKNWDTFWNNPDVTLPSVRLRLAMNRVSGLYNLFVNSPVSPEISKQNRGWQGPPLIFPLESMRNMLEFTKLAIQKELEAPSKLKDVTNTTSQH